MESAIRAMRGCGMSTDQIHAACMRELQIQPAPASEPAHVAASVPVNDTVGKSGSLQLLGSTIDIDFILRAPLIEQGPFAPSDLAAVQFTEGTKSMYSMHAPCQSGKSPSMAFLSLKAVDEGCWVLVLLNINNNQAIANLVAKFTYIHEQLGIDSDIVTDEIFYKGCERALKNKCRLLKNMRNHTIWICKADEDPLSKLLLHVPPEAWQRCVIMFDEVHCFFSLKDESTKKAERDMFGILFGGTSDRELDCVSNMQVRSVVFSDATDGDVPHVLLHLKCDTGDFKRICADPVRLLQRGYVSPTDFTLFTSPTGRQPMVSPFTAGQRFGKDSKEFLPIKTKDPFPCVTGKEFADRVQRCHFDPNLLDFFSDALDGQNSRFLLELTTSNKSERTHNSVEYHAQCVSRLFPGVLALAEHGGGCFHVHADGSKVHYQSHRDAFEDLQESVEAPYHGRPKYMISNIGYGSIQYAFPRCPVTHIYIGFKAASHDNLLVKAQGVGRACGYVRDDLLRLGVSVQVFCTQRDFYALGRGVSTFIDEAYSQYPNHIDGTYSSNTVRDYQLGHHSNPLSAMARSDAVVRTDSQESALPEVQLRQKELFRCIEAEIDLSLPTSRSCLSPTPGIPGAVLTSYCPEYERVIFERYPGVLVTSKVVFFKGDAAQDVQGVRAASDPEFSPAKSDFGMAAKRVQVGFIQRATPRMAFTSVNRSLANARRYNSNPARFGRNGGVRPELSYCMLWGYDRVAQQALGIVKTVPFSQLSLPFIYHQMIMSDDGRLDVRALLVTEAGDDVTELARTNKRKSAPNTTSLSVI